MSVWLQRVDKTWYRFLVTSGVYFLEKCAELSESAAFGQNLRYFTDQNGSKGGPYKNEFWVFSNSEMNITKRSDKGDEKNCVICLVSMFLSWVMVLKLSKSVYFCIFVLTSARDPSVLKQFTYMYLKGRVKRFHLVHSFL